jgi:hypothetical protein
MNEKILKIPYSAVRENWDLLQQFLKMKGNPNYIIVGDVNLSKRQDIFDLGNLVGVEGFFILYGCENIKTLGKLKKVDGNLSLGDSSIESLGELEFVGRGFDLHNCKNIKTLGKLKRVEGILVLSNSNIESLGDLQFIGINLYVNETNIPQSEINKVEVVGRIFIN